MRLVSITIETRFNALYNQVWRISELQRCLGQHPRDPCRRQCTSDSAKSSLNGRPAILQLTRTLNLSNYIMPATRRANVKVGGPANRGGQKTLSFGGRSKVTKPTASAQSKSLEKDAILLEDAIDARSTASSKDHSAVATVESAIQDQVQTEIAKPRTEEEVQARKLKDSQIKKYWKAVEAERRAPRGIDTRLSAIILC